MPDVYIAEGHGRRPDGTFDPGATDAIHTEQRDSKPVAEACTRVLRNHGLDVISESELADDPNFYGTTARANAAGVKCVVSFHYDWREAPPGAFAIATSDDGRELGWAIEARVQDAGFDIRDYPDDRDGLYLLDNSHAPAVIFECGRIGHEDIDETDEQRRMGEAAALGILDWLQEKGHMDMKDERIPDYLVKTLTSVHEGFDDAGASQPFIVKTMVKLVGWARSGGRVWTRKQIIGLIGATAGISSGATVVIEGIIRGG